MASRVAFMPGAGPYADFVQLTQVDGNVSALLVILDDKVAPTARAARAARRTSY